MELQRHGPNGLGRYTEWRMGQLEAQGLGGQYLRDGVDPRQAMGIRPSEGRLMTLLPYLGAWFAASCIAGPLLGRAIRQSAVVAR